MHFAVELPWGIIGLVTVGMVALAVMAYRPPLASLSAAQRAVLTGLRAFVLLALVVFVFRPTVLQPPTTRDAVVPILIDVSRSMRLPDAAGETRMARATTLLRGWLPRLRDRFAVEVFSVGDAVTPTTADRLSPEARRSDLIGALTAVRDRYRGQRVAGIVLVSDGGDTETAATVGNLSAGPPVFAVGVGSPEGVGDREVIGVSAGDPRLDQASVDMHVSAVSTGFGREPFQIRVLQDGRSIENRRVTPASDGSPISESFTVSPDLGRATVYTVEIPAAAGEPVTENNTRTILMSPAGRKRRVLVVEGAPGFEHSFIRRELARDTALEIDVIVRKGKNDQGLDTFLVQTDTARMPTPLDRFPSRREDLYCYDALVIGNVEGDFFTRAQLEMIADFVAERGGGLLVLGSGSFASQGFIGTPIEAVLPLELNDRRGGLARASLAPMEAAEQNMVALTPEGEDHPVMRIGATREESRRVWAALPALATSMSLGAARPGATVLAVTHLPGRGASPLIAVQRYGRGHSMVFAGEASWRWKMLMPSTDRTHEIFWRQTVRWLTGAAPDPIVITVPAAPEPRDLMNIDVDVRDSAFAPVADATLTATLTGPGGETESLVLRPATGGAAGRYTTALRPERPGLYRARVQANRASDLLGHADRWFHVGGADREFADPRLNEGFLRRVARASGGEYVRAADATRLAESLQVAAPSVAIPERRDVWHGSWAFALIVMLLSTEWTLRRRWGLR